MHRPNPAPWCFPLQHLRHPMIPEQTSRWTVAHRLWDFCPPSFLPGCACRCWSFRSCAKRNTDTRSRTDRCRKLISSFRHPFCLYRAMTAGHMFFYPSPAGTERADPPSAPQDGTPCRPPRPRPGWAPPASARHSVPAPHGHMTVGVDADRCLRQAGNRDDIAQILHAARFAPGIAGNQNPSVGGHSSRVELAAGDHDHVLPVPRRHTAPGCCHRSPRNDRPTALPPYGVHRRQCPPRHATPQCRTDRPAMHRLQTRARLPAGRPYVSTRRRLQDSTPRPSVAARPARS